MKHVRKKMNALAPANRAIRRIDGSGSGGAAAAVKPADARKGKPNGKGAGVGGGGGGPAENPEGMDWTNAGRRAAVGSYVRGFSAQRVVIQKGLAMHRLLNGQESPARSDLRRKNALENVKYGREFVLLPAEADVDEDLDCWQLDPLPGAPVGPDDGLRWLSAPRVRLRGRNHRLMFRLIEAPKLVDSKAAKAAGAMELLAHAHVPARLCVRSTVLGPDLLWEDIGLREVAEAYQGAQNLLFSEEGQVLDELKNWITPDVVRWGSVLGSNPGWVELLSPRSGVGSNRPRLVLW